LLPPRLLDDQDARARFLREAETLASLNHPSIIKIHEYGQIDNQPYIVMDYIDGKPLDVIIEKRGGLPLAEALDIARAIASALDYAHAQGIVHRDIKPGNIMIASLPLQGEGRGGVILMDFGIAKSSDSQSGQITGTGIMGTLDYIAPEQISRAAEVDARADVYSFGVLAYQMFTGQLPFRYNNPGALVLAHLNQPAPDPRHITPDMPEDTAVAVMQAMSKKPEYRYRSVGAMVAAMG
jgi:serine/threonine-protein kinase